MFLCSRACMHASPKKFLIVSAFVQYSGHLPLGVPYPSLGTALRPCRPSFFLVSSRLLVSCTRRLSCRCVVYSRVPWRTASRRILSLLFFFGLPLSHTLEARMPCARLKVQGSAVVCAAFLVSCCSLLWRPLLCSRNLMVPREGVMLECVFSSSFQIF